MRCRELKRWGSNSPALQSLLFTSIPRYTFFFWSRTTIYLDSRGESWTMLIILTTRIHSNEGTGIKRTYGVTSGVISFYLFHLCFYLLYFAFYSLFRVQGKREEARDGQRGRQPGHFLLCVYTCLNRSANSATASCTIKPAEYYQSIEGQRPQLLINPLCLVEAF